DRESGRRYAARKDPRAQRNGCPRRLRACEFLLYKIFEWKDPAALMNRSAVPVAWRKSFLALLRCSCRPGWLAVQPMPITYFAKSAITFELARLARPARGTSEIVVFAHLLEK